MINIGKFNVYNPRNALAGVLYLQSDDKKDWYESQVDFANDTIKVVYESSGKVVSVTTDVSSLFPLDMWVAELPAGSKVKIGDYFKNGKIVTPPASDYHIWDGKKWTLSEKNITALLADKKAEKLTEINAKAQAFVSNAAGLDKVPEYEVKTWQTQGEEAKAWHLEKSAVTPNLDAIAAARGIPADVLKAKAYEKTVKFELLTAVVAGLRQGYEDANKAAKTLEEVEKINPIYKLPEIKDE